jgi:hypothetical protein
MMPVINSRQASNFTFTRRFFHFRCPISILPCHASELAKNHLGCFPRGFWEGFTELAHLDLDETFDSRLCGPDWLTWLGESLPKLTTLKLDNTFITELPTTAFNGFPELESLDLARNQISLLSPLLFAQNQKLKEVNLLLSFRSHFVLMCMSSHSTRGNTKQSIFHLKHLHH